MTNRFEVVTFGTRYKVIDNSNKQYVGYSYGKPVYENEGKDVKFFVWNNYNSALGFAYKMNARNPHSGFPNSLSD